MRSKFKLIIIYFNYNINIVVKIKVRIILIFLENCLIILGGKIGLCGWIKKWCECL